MTDIAALQRKAQAARETAVVVGPATYTLRQPTKHEINLEVLRSRGADNKADPAQPAVLTRRLLEMALVGWSGVTQEQLAPGGGADAAELVPGAVALLLDNDLTTADRLLDAFIELSEKRSARLEAAEKN